MAIAVMINVTGTLQGNHVLWKRATLWRLRLVSNRLRYLVGGGGLSAADWIDHRKSRSVGSPEIFSDIRKKSFVSGNGYCNRFAIVGLTPQTTIMVRPVENG